MGVSEAKYFSGGGGVVTVPARGDASVGQSFILPHTPIEVLWVKWIDDDGKENVVFEASDAGDGSFAKTGADGRTIKMGAKIAIPARTQSQDPNVFIRIVTAGVGWSADLEAVKVSEQYALQGDAEARHVKRIATWIETDKDTHFTAGVSNQAGTVAESKFETENVTGMPWNKFVVRQIIMEAVSSISPDVRLWFFSSDTFRNDDMDSDKVIGYVDFASIHAVRVAGVGQKIWQVPELNHNLLKAVVSISNSLAPLIYNDEDGTNELHILLENRSPDVDLAAAASRFKFRFWVEPLA